MEPFLIMATITLKNIPDELYEQLKTLAKARHRSVNSEIIYNLEKAVGTVKIDRDELRKEIAAFRDEIAKRGTLTPEEIEKAINKGRP